ncbi:MAG: sigma-70 family RNA polymerase sigma factor [Patescibacteria group bacterium]
MDKPSISDRDMLIRVKNGEIDCFAHFVKKFTPRIYTYISSQLFDKTHTDDLVQNSFIAFYKAINRLDNDRPVLPYLYEIAKNELKMFYRKHKEMLSFDEKIINEQCIHPQTEETQDIESFLTHVGPLQKKALVMVSEGYSYKEIADKLGKKLNTTRTLIRRARQLLISKKNNENTGT